MGSGAVPAEAEAEAEAVGIVLSDSAVEVGRGAPNRASWGPGYRDPSLCLFSDDGCLDQQVWNTLTPGLSSLGLLSMPESSYGIPKYCRLVRVVHSTPIGQSSGVFGALCGLQSQLGPSSPQVPAGRSTRHILCPEQRRLWANWECPFHRHSLERLLVVSLI